MKTEIVMQYVKSTKGTHVYGNSDADVAISTVYIKRTALPSSPKEIKLTLEAK